MRLRRQTRHAKFFDLFAQAGANISVCVEVPREFVATPPEQQPELARRMHEVEHAGAETTHTILDQQQREREPVGQLVDPQPDRAVLPEAFLATSVEVCCARCLPDATSF